MIPAQRKEKEVLAKASFGQLSFIELKGTMQGTRGGIINSLTQLWSLGYNSDWVDEMQDVHNSGMNGYCLQIEFKAGSTGENSLQVL